MKYLPMKELLQDLTKTAGNLLLDSFGKDPRLLGLRSSAKEAITRYDKMADELIVHRIREAYPEHSLLTGESGLIGGDPNWLWIVDSLDGINNFAALKWIFDTHFD